ncbi:hypothetical protein BD309DRAFT_282343 [Dichomitus squalens]|nr:hypothetical protein BD309DRAFT_282343 [Dichomitus squalens]
MSAEDGSATAIPHPLFLSCHMFLASSNPSYLWAGAVCPPDSEIIPKGLVIFRHKATGRERRTATIASEYGPRSVAPEDPFPRITYLKVIPLTSYFAISRPGDWTRFAKAKER